MIELQGSYASAKIFTDVVEETALNQVMTLLDQPYVAGSRVRMMPDIHAGSGCTIGTTMTVTDKICPNLVGVDIGCGMETIRIAEQEMDLEKLDRVIRAYIPSGFDIHPQPVSREIDLSALHCARQVNLDRAYRSIGTLGGGNHFIEADRDDRGRLYVVVHSGSRHLGLEVAKYYQAEAYRYLQTVRQEDVRSVVAELKAAGRQAEINEALAALKPRNAAVPKELAYVEGALFEQYLHDMQIAQRFATLSRKTMMDAIVTHMGLHVVDRFSTVHNYIDMEHHILRKGAVSAQRGERLLIPINMRDGSLICVGKGNPDWNCSAPHGAGRLMSRAQAKTAFTVAEFRRQMDGIYTTSVGTDTLDECPMAYKPMADIVDNIAPTAEIETVIRPIYNFKAGCE